MLVSALTRRICVMVDIEHYGLNHNRAQVGLQDRLVRIVDRTVAAALPSRRSVRRQAQGDGQLILLPPGANEPRTVAYLIRGLSQYLDDDNKRFPTLQIRLRAAMAQGVVRPGRNGYAGNAITTAARLVDSPVIRQELTDHAAAALALIVAADIYEDVIIHNSGDLPVDRFQHTTVELSDKGWRGEAWYCSLAPGSVQRLPRQQLGSLTGPMAAAAGFNLGGTDVDPALIDGLNDIDPGTYGTDEHADGATDQPDHSYEAGEYAADEHDVSYDHGDATEHVQADYESFEVSFDSDDLV